MIRAQYRCELCGGSLDQGMSVHHRKPRRMGGTKKSEINSPTNLLVLCGSGTTGCHGKVESNRLKAVEDGIILRDSDDPETTLVKDIRNRWWKLEPSGLKYQIKETPVTD